MALISISKKFIFIHIYKCAGTSMAESLRPWCQNNVFDKILTKLNLLPSLASIESEVPHHPTALEVKKHLKSKYWNNYYKFAFTRNPFDMEVSLYHYMLQNENHRQHDLIKSMVSFDEYIDWRVKNDLHNQHRYVIDTKGDLIVDFIGKFENLNDDFEIVCNSIGIPCNLPKLNQSKRQNDYQKYYSKYSQKLVEEYFAKDLEIFNYEF
jgi:hypothetical protein